MSEPSHPGIGTIGWTDLTVESRLVVGMLLLLVLSVGPASSRPTAAGAFEAIDVALVNVDVWVLDRDGMPVTDLEAKDFRLVVDGQSLDITNFARIGVQPVSTSSQPNGARAPAGNHRLAIYVDTAFLRSRELSAAVPILAEFLRLDLPASVAVLLASADPDFQILAEFTTDRELILTRLHAMTSTIGKNRIEREYSLLQREFEQVLGRASSGAMPSVPGAQADSVLTQIGAFAASVQEEIERAAAHLDFLVSSLQGLSEGSEILFLTGRPPAHAGPALLAAWREEMGQNLIFSPGGEGAQGGGQGSQGAAVSGLPDISGFGSHTTSINDLDAAEALRQAASHAAAAGVTIHAIDMSSSQQDRSLVSTATAGQGVPGNPGGGFTRSASIEQGIPDLRLLKEITNLTGGELFRGSDLASGLPAILSRRAMYYSLAFTAPQGLGDDSHEITVQLTDPDPTYALAHRRFFRLRNHDQEAAQATVSSMLLNEVQNPLEVHLDMRLHRGDDSATELAEIQLVLPFARIALRPEGHHHIGQLSVFSLWGELFHQASPVRKGVLPIRIANDEMLTALGRSVEYSWTLEIPAGTSFVAVGIRDDLSHLLSTIVISAPEDP